MKKDAKVYRVGYSYSESGVALVTAKSPEGAMRILHSQLDYSGLDDIKVDDTFQRDYSVDPHYYELKEVIPCKN